MADGRQVEVTATASSCRPRSQRRRPIDIQTTPSVPDTPTHAYCINALTPRSHRRRRRRDEARRFRGVVGRVNVVLAGVETTRGVVQ